MLLPFCLSHDADARLDEEEKGWTPDSWGISAEVYFHGTVDSNYRARFLPKQAWERCRQPCAPSLIRLEKVTVNIKCLWLRELCPVNTQGNKRRHWWRIKPMKCKAMFQTRCFKRQNWLLVNSWGYICIELAITHRKLKWNLRKRNLLNCYSKKHR